MCNRYIAPEQARIERVWQLGRDQNVVPWQPGIYPRSDGPFIRASEQRELVVGQRGLIPGFTKSRTLKYSTNNA